MEIILDLQGFKTSNNEFVVKELASFTVRKNVEGVHDLSCFFFEPSCEWIMLPQKYQRMNLWLTHNYRGIDWETGRVSYSKLREVLDVILCGREYIYVKGEEKVHFSHRIIGYLKRVINLDNLECPTLKLLPKPNCQRCSYHRKCDQLERRNYICARENVQQLKSWFMQCFTNEPSLKRSLKLFSQLRDIKMMKAEDIARIPKRILLLLTSNNIDEIWDKLPEDCKQYTDIADCRKCHEHYPYTGARDYDDEFDGPIPKIKNCYECKKKNTLSV